MEKIRFMGRLLILGNINKGTFVNTILSANNKAKEIWQGDKLNEIYVIHTQQSFNTLFVESKNGENWIDKLRRSGLYDISESTFINRIMDWNAPEFLLYIKQIVEAGSVESLMIDITNGDSVAKARLVVVSYVLGIKNVFYLDSRSLMTGKKDCNWSEQEIISCYKQFEYDKKIDEFAYKNLTDVTRYKEKVDELAKIYTIFDEELSDDSFFKNNLLNAIKLKLNNDKETEFDYSMYRIASVAMTASLEDLIDRLILKYGGESIEGKTLGSKIHILQNIMKEKQSVAFDYRFLEKFNEFILYLRNSTTHKGLIISKSEKFKSALTMQMSLIFLEYYSTVIAEELKINDANMERESGIREQIPEAGMYYGLDGDNTGASLENCMLNNVSDNEIKRFSVNIRKAKDTIANYIKKQGGQVIFAEGDDILFKGNFSQEDLENMKNVYYEISEGQTCSIGYGSTLRDALFFMKIAKIRKNSIRGGSVESL